MSRPILAALAAGASLLCGEPVAGPVEGFFFDAPVQRFRAVRGMLGSATLAPAQGPEYRMGWVAPARNWAIGCREARCFALTGLGAETPQEVALEGDYPDADGAAWTPDGSAVVVYSRRAGWVRRVTGLPAAPVEEGRIDTAALPGSLVCVEALANGDSALALSGNNGGVFLLRSGAFLPLLEIAQPVGLSADRQGRRLYVLTPSGSVTVLAVDTGAVEATYATDLADARALRYAARASGPDLVYVAGGSDQALVVLAAASGEVIARRDLPVAPGGLEQLGRASLLCGGRKAAGEPLWSVSLGEDPGVFFIPAGEAEGSLP